MSSYKSINSYIQWLDTRNDLNRLLPNVSLHHLYNKYREGTATEEDIRKLNLFAMNYMGQPALYSEFVEEMFNPETPIVCYVGKTPYSDFDMALSDANGKYAITLAKDVEEELTITNAVIDLNGYTLSNMFFSVGNNVSLYNGTLNGNNTFALGNFDSNLNIYNVNFTSESDSQIGMSLDYGNVTLRNCVFNVGSADYPTLELRYNYQQGPHVTLDNVYMTGYDNKGTHTTGAISFKVGDKFEGDPMQWDATLKINGGTYDINWSVDKELQAKLNSDTVVFIDEKAYFVNDNKFGYKDSGSDVNEVKLEIFNKTYLDGLLETDSLYSIIPDEDNYIYVENAKQGWRIPTVYRGTASEISSMKGSFVSGALYIATDADKIYIAEDANRIKETVAITTDYYNFVKNKHNTSELYFIDDDNVYIATANNKFEPFNVDPDVNEVTLAEFDNMYLKGELETDSLYSIIPDEDNYIYVEDAKQGWRIPTVYRGTASEISSMKGSFVSGAVYIDTDYDITYIAVNAETLLTMEVNTIDYYTFVDISGNQDNRLFFLDDYNVYIATSNKDFKPYKNDNSGDDPLTDDPLVVEGDTVTLDTLAELDSLAGKGGLVPGTQYYVVETGMDYVATSEYEYEVSGK